MIKYIFRRSATALLTLFIISIIIFTLIHLQKGNPYSYLMSPNISPEAIEKKLTELGYYDPIYLKYIKWLKTVFTGSFGYSIKYSKPVLEVIGSRIGNTLILTSTSLFLSFILGTLLGYIAAIFKNSLTDDLINSLSFGAMSIPSFFLALLLIKFFSYDLSILPASGISSVRENYTGIARFYDILRHMILPVAVLVVLNLTIFIRYTRASLIEIIHKDYIKAAMAKGMGFKTALLRHGYKNALIPILTVLMTQLPSLFSGALMTETVFVWPGIGRLGYEAILNRDYPLIMGILIISATMILLCNLALDFLYIIIDKRMVNNL